MPLTTTKKMLQDAQHNNYAVAAFNCENMEMIQAIIAAGEETDSPIILQTTPSTLRYASPYLFAANATAAAKDAKIPVAMHLDHGNSEKLAQTALDAGYTSIMIDGSQLPLEENIAFTIETAKLCRTAGIPLEGELGHVGGKEDDMIGGDAGYTDPDEAVRFVAETGVDSLAVGIGTAHGVYMTKPVLKPELISVLRNTISVPLVLHGASGLDDDVIKDCIARGICKVNIATELRIAYTKAVRELLSSNADCIDPKEYGKFAKDAVKKLAINRILVCGCQGQSNQLM